MFSAFCKEFLSYKYYVNFCLYLSFLLVPCEYLIILPFFKTHIFIPGVLNNLLYLSIYIFLVNQDKIKYLMNSEPHSKIVVLLIYNLINNLHINFFNV